MTKHVIIIGAGVGGLSAAVRLARRGLQVTVLESRDHPGGLAANVQYEGFSFDAGPYVLLDRPGLEWALAQLEIPLSNQIDLQRIDHLYQLENDDEPTVEIYDSLERTMEEMERQWTGSAPRYHRFIDRMATTYRRLQSLQRMAHPGPISVLRSGAWRELPFLFRSLQSVLRAAQLPGPVTKALGIWTHVAGQTMGTAPSPLALVPAVIHSLGAYYPLAGIGSIARLLFEQASGLGVNFQFGTAVRQIRCAERRVVGVETEEETYPEPDAVISNVGLGTYLQLLDQDGRSAIPPRQLQRLAELPLQSPGVCAYLAVRGRVEPPYLRFRLLAEPDGCRLFVTPAALDAGLSRDGWSPARLIAPMHHERSEAGGPVGQRGFLDRVLAESWWRQPFDEVRVLHTRIPAEWGRAFHLYRNSMNPVMTAAFMRAGRLAHRSPWIRYLYLSGSATHPGQWVSFCAISGVLTADRVLQDFKRI